MGQEEVKKALKRKGSWLMSNEIAKATGNSLKSIQSSLRRLVKWGEVKKEPASKVIQDGKRLKEKSFSGYAYKIKDCKTLDDFKFKDKTVLLRLDLNSSHNPFFTPSENFSNHLPTILELIEKQAKIVILSHQDSKDEIESLEPHTSYLSKKLNKPVFYVNDLYGKEAEEKIKSLKPGEILILKNLMSLKEEKKTKLKKQSKTKLVASLSKLADIYVNDSFSLSHLDWVSITGFPQVMPSCLGRFFEKEIEVVNQLFDPTKPCLYILGGNKPDPFIQLIKTSLEGNRANIILTTGPLSHLLHLANNKKLGGQENELKKLKIKISPELKELSKKNNSIILPKDYYISTFGVKENVLLANLPVYQTLGDIGKETLQDYISAIKEAKTIFIKGLPGRVESPEFQDSTKILLNEIANSQAFSFILGDSTVEAFKNFNIPIKNITHLSKNTEPILAYLSEKPLPALEVLKIK